MINSSQLRKLHRPTVGRSDLTCDTHSRTVYVADMFAKMTEVAVADANATPDPDTGYTFHTHRWHKLWDRLSLL